ncbi:m127 protein [Murid betaherpesvirus 1]|nr:m127 protein [Murid betaherpesvirus 1]
MENKRDQSRKVRSCTRVIQRSGRLRSFAMSARQSTWIRKEEARAGVVRGLGRTPSIMNKKVTFPPRQCTSVRNGVCGSVCPSKEDICYQLSSVSGRGSGRDEQENVLELLFIGSVSWHSRTLGGSRTPSPGSL